MTGVQTCALPILKSTPASTGNTTTGNTITGNTTTSAPDAPIATPKTTSAPDAPIATPKTYGNQNVSGQQIKDYFAQYKGDPKKVIEAAKAYGLSEGDVSEVLGYSLDDIKKFQDVYGAPAVSTPAQTTTSAPAVSTPAVSTPKTYGNQNVSGQQIKDYFAQ